LFATWQNALLTVVGRYVIFPCAERDLALDLGAGFGQLPFTERVREILQGQSAACFSVLTGVAPVAVRGSNTLRNITASNAALVLMFFRSGAPCLFFVWPPRKLLIFTALFPSSLTGWSGGRSGFQVFALAGFIAVI